IHWPVRTKKGIVVFQPENLIPTDIPATWKAMEALYDCGKARAIGVSNFSSKKLGDLLDIAHIPPAVNQVECHPSWQQTKLSEFCKSRAVHLSGYSPLGSPGTEWLKSDVLNHPILTSVAEKLGKTPAQVALRWGLQMGHSVLPKSTNEARIKENLDARLVRGDFLVNDTYGDYKTVEELWDGEISEARLCLFSSEQCNGTINDIPVLMYGYLLCIMVYEVSVFDFINDVIAL
ncbi:NADPH-dependent aldo-keto reductase, chloroplastic, partial [Tanacetum coccineum]